MVLNVDTAFFDEDDRELLIKLICKEQLRMITKDSKKYDSDKYKRLEALKVVINDWSIA